MCSESVTAVTCGRERPPEPGRGAACGAPRAVASGPPPGGGCGPRGSKSRRRQIRQRDLGRLQHKPLPKGGVTVRRQGDNRAPFLLLRLGHSNKVRLRSPCDAVWGGVRFANAAFRRGGFGSRERNNLEGLSKPRYLQNLRAFGPRELQPPGGGGSLCSHSTGCGRGNCRSKRILFGMGGTPRRFSGWERRILANRHCLFLFLYHLLYRQKVAPKTPAKRSRRGIGTLRRSERQ